MFSSHPIMEEYWVWYTVGQLMHATLLLMGFQGLMFNAFHVKNLLIILSWGKGKQQIIWSQWCPCSTESDDLTQGHAADVVATNSFLQHPGRGALSLITVFSAARCPAVCSCTQLQWWACFVSYQAKQAWFGLGTNAQPCFILQGSEPALIMQSGHFCCRCNTSWLLFFTSLTNFVYFQALQAPQLTSRDTFVTLTRTIFR